MDINKIEELFDKVRVAGKIIAEYKQLLEAERLEVGELKKQIAFLQKDNQCLKEENDRLKMLSSSAEKMHKDLENRIISMLDVLPDFDSLKNEVPAPAVETVSPAIMEMDFNSCDKEENESSSLLLFLADSGVGGAGIIFSSIKLLGIALYSSGSSFKILFKLYSLQSEAIFSQLGFSLCKNL